MKGFVVRVIVLACLLVARGAHAQLGGSQTPEARLQLEGQAYAGMPFGIAVVAEGFDQDPKPAQPALAIAGATVTPLGAEPQVQRISINGQRYDSVTWVFHYRVEADKAGDLQVPPVTVEQGSKKATANGGRLPVTSIDPTDDMKLEVHVPDRPLWLGEVAELEIDWLLRKNVHDQQLSVPLFSMTQDFAVSAPPAADPRQVVAFPAGASDLQLPFTQDHTTENGVDYTRFKFTALVTPLRAGTIELPPAQVVASLEVGTTRDQFGFPTARTQLFRASDIARTLTVKPLPSTGKPADFAGAVGSSFSIATQSSRSVVELGEPVELTITVKGDTRLDGLTLGALAGPGRLPADKFQVPDQLPPGELSEDGKTKTFKVSVQVTDLATREIPPIELAWFDPTSAQYRTTRSEPIALSVKGGTVVGAGDVVGGKPAPAADVEAPSSTSLVGADLALSAPGAALEQPFGGPTLYALIAILYLVPLGLLGFRVWQVRTRGAREEKGEVAAARKKVDDVLAKARTAPAREIAASLTGALRGLARIAGVSAEDPLLAKIETEAFAPSAGERPLPESLRKDAEALADRWTGAARRGRGAAAIVVLALISVARAAHADAIDDGRTAYQDAMAQADPTARQAAFARAERAFADAVTAHPDSPELLADWGNAALGAADFGTATLAFRRALLADGDHARARRNLDWLRSRLPGNLRPHEGGATARLFFFVAWSRATRLIVGALLFALAALLVVPWRGRAPASRIGLAIVPLLAWALVTGSVLFEQGPGSDGVVVEVQVLRSADSAGAPAANATPLPPGAEVSVLERRDGWAHVRTAGGLSGWLPDAAVASVAR